PCLAGVPGVDGEQLGRERAGRGGLAAAGRADERVGVRGTAAQGRGEGGPCPGLLGGRGGDELGELLAHIPSASRTRAWTSATLPAASTVASTCGSAAAARRAASRA